MCSLLSVNTYADMYSHNLQVFTANTMEIPCSTTPKELFFGKPEVVMEMSKKEIKTILDHGIDQAGSSVGSWVNASGISGKDLGANIGAGLIGSYLGTLTKNLAYKAMDDEEYMLVSECNSGKNYTRLITMVVSNKELDLNTAKALAKQDQAKVMRKVYR